ncbi:transcriptional regulator, IclR family [Rhizobiales bacterium GAS188]|nr:transcriptional regulator, IclR family [Rhizobiales bacterium GAS188]
MGATADCGSRRETPDSGIHMVGSAETSATGTLTRGLELLRLLNEAYPLQIRDLHALTGLPKPTISRLLATLRAAGYVQRDGAAGYRPSSKVHVLSAGVSSQAWIHEVAVPVIDRLSQAIHWPSDFAIFEGRGMTIRYTTRPTAPITISDPINTAGLPMLESDFGRAFLAFASSEQQARILAALARSERKLDAAARDAELTRRLLDATRHQGFATRGESFTFIRASTIAVAVTVAGQSVAALNVICSTRFMDPTDIPKRYLKPLQRAAAEIGAALSWDGFVVAARKPCG